MYDRPVVLEAGEKAATPSAVEPEKAQAKLSMGPSVVAEGAHPSDDDTKAVLGGQVDAQDVEPKLHAGAVTQAAQGVRPVADTEPAAHGSISRHNDPAPKKPGVQTVQPAAVAAPPTPAVVEPVGQGTQGVPS